MKVKGNFELLDEIGPSMDRHAKLVQYVHQVRYKISEGHGKTISWRNEFVRVQKRGFGPMISLLVVRRRGAGKMTLHSFIVDSGGDHFGLEMLKSATRMNPQKVLDFTVTNGLCGGPGDAHLPHF